MGADIRARQAREEAQKRESTDAIGGRNARMSDGHTRQELYAKAQRRHIEGAAPR
jgi:hypothetical protein